MKMIFKIICYFKGHKVKKGVERSGSWAMDTYREDVFWYCTRCGKRNNWSKKL